MSELRNLPTQSAVLGGGLDFNRVHLCRASYLGVGGSSRNPNVWRADGDDCDVDGILELRAECIVHNHPNCATDIDQHRAMWRCELRRRGFFSLGGYLCFLASHCMLHYCTCLRWSVPAPMGADYDSFVRRFSTQRQVRFWRKIVTTAIGVFTQGYSWRSTKAVHFLGICCPFSSRSPRRRVLLDQLQERTVSRTTTTYIVRSQNQVASMPIIHIEQLSGVLATQVAPTRLGEIG